MSCIYCLDKFLMLNLFAGDFVLKGSGKDVSLHQVLRLHWLPLCPVDMTLYSFTECLCDTRIRVFVYSLHLNVRGGRLVPHVDVVTSVDCLQNLHCKRLCSVFQKFMHRMSLYESMSSWGCCVLFFYISCAFHLFIYSIICPQLQNCNCSLAG